MRGPGPSLVPGKSLILVMRRASDGVTMWGAGLSGRKEEKRNMRVEESIKIDRPVEEVFSYVANPENLPEWSGLAIEVKDAPVPLGEGDTFSVVGKFLGRRFETPFELTSYEPNRHYTHRARGGPIPDQDWTYTYEEVSGGTRLTRTVEGEPGGFFKLAEPLIERALKRQVRTDMETLKDLLEAEG
jgi:uncharacterized protein YndB with AHSA1/START domain